MLVFGHTGLTLGAASILAGLSKNNSSRDRGISRLLKNSSFFTVLASMDIRLLLIGSLLPDIIDKPVGLFLFKDIFSDGRIFSHTLLFLILLVAASFFMYRRYHVSWMVPMAFGSFTHLVFDFMWQSPQTLFWPLFGFSFERINVDTWLYHIFLELYTRPDVYITELLGVAILLWFGIRLVRRKKIGLFIKHGRSF